MLHEETKVIEIVLKPLYLARFAQLGFFIVEKRIYLDTIHNGPIDQMAHILLLNSFLAIKGV